MQLSLHETFFAVLTGVVLLFATATALGAWLESRTSDTVKLAWIHQLNQRIRGSWAIVGVFALGFALGGEALTVVFALASFFALREFVALTPIRSSDHWALVIAFYLVIPVQYILVAGGWYGWYAVFIPVYVFLLLPVVMALRQDNERYLERVAKVQWGLMISVYCVSHAPAIASIEIAGHEGRGALLLLHHLDQLPPVGGNGVRPSGAASLQSANSLANIRPRDTLFVLLSVPHNRGQQRRSNTCGPMCVRVRRSIRTQ